MWRGVNPLFEVTSGLCSFWNIQTKLVFTHQDHRRNYKQVVIIYKVLFNSLHSPLPSTTDNCCSRLPNCHDYLYLHRFGLAEDDSCPICHDGTVNGNHISTYPNRTTSCLDLVVTWRLDAEWPNSDKQRFWINNLQSKKPKTFLFSFLQTLSLVLNPNDWFTNLDWHKS